MEPLVQATKPAAAGDGRRSSCKREPARGGKIMAFENVARIYETVMQDESLQEQIGNLKTEEVPAAFVKLGQQQGVQVSEDEVREAIVGNMKRQEGELNEEQLEAVAGGYCVVDCLPSGTGALKEMGSTLQFPGDSFDTGTRFPGDSY